jgi:hypothetical protein
MLDRPAAARALVAAVLLAVASRDLYAQRSRIVDRDTDADWLDDCRDRDRSDREVFCEIRTYGFRATGRAIAVDARDNGGIHFVGWDRDSVAVHARIQAQARDEGRAEEIAKEIRVDARSSTIRADGPSTGRRESWVVSYVVYVPRTSDLEAETVNGPVGVEDVKGRMDLRAVNGPLVLTGVAGDVRGRTQNGPLAVRLTGSRWDGEGLDAETRNGPVTMDIPSGYSARLETGTVNGPMQIDFPITVQGRINRTIETTLGQGGATVRARTTNGPLVIRRR